MNPAVREIVERVAHELEIPSEAIHPLVTTPPDQTLGDYALPCFVLAQKLGRSPQEIARQLARALSGEPTVDQAEASGPYLNITVERQALFRPILEAIRAEGESYGSRRNGEGRTIVIDYSSPNIARPFSVGHLRSTVLGHALKLIYRHLGDRVIGVNHLGDWGKQFGALIAAYERWGCREAVEQDQVYELFRLYVKFHEEADVDPGLEEEARAWFKRLERGDPGALGLWKWFTDESLRAFRRYYDMLGIEFEETRGESAYREQTGPLIERLLEEGIAEERRGAIVVPFGGENGQSEGEIPSLVVRTSEGTTVYSTRDLCAAIYHKEQYDFAKKLYVVDAGQSLHFQQLIETLAKMGYSWAKDLVHVAFGVVLFEDQRMSTRRGRVVFFEDVATQAVVRTREVIESIAKATDLDDVQRQQVAQEVGVGAVIYATLSRSRTHDINFRWNEVLNFEGKSGPYIQYTHARLAGVLRKYGGDLPDSPDYGLLTHSHEVALVKELEQFPAKLQQAADDYEPFVIAEFLGDVAAAANKFYDTCRVLGEDPPLEAARIMLVYGAKTVLKTGLTVLGIAAPDRM